MGGHSVKTYFVAEP